MCTLRTVKNSSYRKLKKLKYGKKEVCFRDDVDGWRCRWFELLLLQSMDIWFL